MYNFTSYKTTAVSVKVVNNWKKLLATGMDGSLAVNGKIASGWNEEGTIAHDVL